MLKPAGLDEWQSWYDSTPVASCFQSPDWARLWSQYTGGKYQPAPLLARLSSGKTVLMPLSRQLVMRGLGSAWHAAPAGTYGGWLTGTNRALNGKHTAELIRELLSHCGSLTYRWFPFMVTDSGKETLRYDSQSGTLEGVTNWIDYSKDLKPALKQMTVIPDHTRVLDCSDGYDSIIRDKQWRSRIQPMLNKAAKLGVTVRQASTMWDWERYHKRYLDTATGWDPPPSHIYSMHFFRLLADLPECRLWLAEIAGKPVAGAIVLYGRNHTTYWHGASDHSHRSAGAANLLISRLIEDNCSRGQRWFDFNPSMGISGVDAFKRSFGAIAVEAPVLEKMSGPFRFLRWVSRKRASITGAQTVDSGSPS